MNQNIYSAPEQVASDHEVAMFSIYMAIGLTFLALFTPLFLFVFHLKVIGLSCLIDFCVFIPLLVQVRHTRRITMVADVLCLMVVATLVIGMVDGGVAGTEPYFAFPGAVFMYFLAKRGRGTLWVGVMLVFFILTFVASAVGIIALPYLPVEFMFFMISFGLFITFLHYYAQEKEKLDTRLQISLGKVKSLAAGLEEEKEDVERKVALRTEELHVSLQTTQGERDKVMAIIQAIGDGVFVLDEKKVIVSINHVTEQLTGYKADELMGVPYTSVLKFISEKDSSPSTGFIDRVYELGVVSAMARHTMLLRKDGTTVAVSDSAAPLKDAAGVVTGCVVVFRDVTEERKVERMKDQFISLTSHQLRTPLTAANWITKRLLNVKTGTLNEVQTGLIKDVQESVARLTDLVNDLLDVGRIESGRINVASESTDIPELVRSVMHELSSMFEIKNQTSSLKADADVSEIFIDPKLVRQVLVNLLSNASKYTPEKGTIAMRIYCDKEELCIDVSDTGVGIPVSQQQLIFGRFFRANNVVDTGNEGTGLGLYLVKEIIEALGGRIWFESTEGTGTTFSLAFPIAGGTGGGISQQS